MKRLESFLGGDGQYHHDSDCWIYAVNGNCTCGLLHIIHRDPNSELYQQFSEDLMKHEMSLHFLNANRIPVAKSAFKDMSEEEFISILRKAGWDI